MMVFLHVLPQQQLTVSNFFLITEVFIFSSMIGYFLSYLTLSATTQWTTEGVS